MLNITRWTVALGAALAVGCSGGDGSKTGSSGPDVPLAQADSKLVAVQSCGELETYIKAVAVAELDKGVAYYTTGIGAQPPVAVAEDDLSSGGEPPASPDPTGGQGNDGGGTPKHSDTNNQIVGVDEADLVKTDGEYLYTVDGSLLRIVKTFPAAETALTAELELGAWATELFLSGDTLLVYGQTWGHKGVDNTWWDGGGVGGGSTPPSSGGGAAPNPATPAPTPDDAPDGEPSDPAGKPGVAVDTVQAELSGQVTVLAFIDVSDRSAPQVVRTFALEGSYASARRIGTKVYTVTRGNLHVPGVGYGYPVSGGGVVVDAPAVPPSTDAGAPDEPSSGSSDGAAPPAFAAGKADTAPEEVPSGDEIKAAYLAKLNEQTLDDWLPKAIDITSAGAEVTTLAGCGDFYKPSVQQGLATVTVVSFDLADPTAAPAVTTTLGQVGTVFASANAIYAASYVYDYWFWTDAADKDGGEYSVVHKFAYDDAGVSYAGSGKVPGQILNQFSMDEHDGHLRVATTTRNWATSGVSDNGVYVLGAADSLSVVGSVTGLAPGEEIYSARFMGDRGYVVTFERVDPLFTLDLSDHTAPTVLGELKIPGFSTYIHPLGDNHLLTVGQETIDNGEWVQVAGIQVQVFDVTDLANPTLAHKQTFEDTWSEALYDHRAFSFFADDGLLAIPYESYGDGEMSWDAGILVFNVDAAAGITHKGTVSHLPLTEDENGWFRGVQVRRTLMIEDHLYSLSTAGVMVNAASDLSEVAQVGFTPADGWGKDLPGGPGDPEPTPAPEPTPGS